MIYTMENKYDHGGKKRKTFVEPSEDEFLAIQKKLDHNKKNKK